MRPVTWTYARERYLSYSLVTAGTEKFTWGTEELDGSESTLRNNPVSTTRFCAPSNNFALNESDFRVWFGCTPEAEVCARKQSVEMEIFETLVHTPSM